jgi:flavin reductase (DIM6/NTAB) family NADH-FMN oxidoreductase RutF
LENDWISGLLICRRTIEEVDTMPTATFVILERPAAVGPDRLRALMRRFATGVTVVTCPGPDGPEGTTVNAFTPVSLHPPQVLVCLDRGSRTLPTILSAGRFAVNVLGWDQRELVARFADKTRTPAQRFAGIRASILVTGSPVVPGSLAVMDCLLSRAWPCGDHMLLVGDVVEGLAGRAEEPLVFYRGGFSSVAIPQQGAVGGCIGASSRCAPERQAIDDVQAGCMVVMDDRTGRTMAI